MFWVADQLERGDFWARVSNDAAGSIDFLYRHSGEVLSGDKLNPDSAARERGSVLANDHLGQLGALVSRAVVLRRLHEAKVVRLMVQDHELRNELLGREAPQLAILWRNDNEETTGGRSDRAMLLEAAELSRDGLGAPS